MKNLVDYLNESRSGVPENIKQVLKNAISNGYIKQDGVKYGISRENIFNIESLDIPEEEIKKVIDQFEKEGVKFHFETDEEWKKAGFKDPNED